MQSGWQGNVQGAWYILSNPSIDDSEQVLVLPPGGIPDDGRRVSMLVAIDSQAPNAALGLVTRGPNPRDICVAEVTAGAQANLFCVLGGTYKEIGKLTGAARLDGNDVIEIVEIPGAARYYVNGQALGDVTDAVAINHEVGLMAYGRGSFGVSNFTISNATTGAPLATGSAAQMPGGTSKQPASPPPTAGGAATGSPGQAGGASSMGDLAATIANTPIKEGWTLQEQGNWLVLENTRQASSEQVFLTGFGAAPAAGRIFSVNLAVEAPAGQTASNLPHSALGILVENHQTKASCAGEITLAGKAIVLCFNAEGKAQELGSIDGAAKLDGSDRLQYIEFPNGGAFALNDQIIAELTGQAAIGGDVGLIAYERGRFYFSDFYVQTLSAGAGTDGGAAGGGAGQTPPAPGNPPPGNSPSGAAGGAAPAGGIDPAYAYLAGEGPVPNFGGDRSRMIGAYLGVTQSIFMHEFGHALIGELQLPSTGPEEDAVDIFSALQIVEPTMYPSDDAEINRIGTETATYAALQWFYSGKLAEQNGSETIWQDEHTADLKRFRNVFCVIYGGNPQVYAPIASGVGMDERTLSRCNTEFTKQNRAWRALLAPHTRVDAWHPEGMQPQSAGGAPVNVSFEPSRFRIGNMIREVFGAPLQDNLQALGKTYIFPRPITVTFKDCDELNAWYDPSQGTITMCYDLVVEMVTMVSDIEMGTQGGYNTGGNAAGGAGAASDAGASAGGSAPNNSPFGGNAAGAQQLPSGQSTLNELEDFGVPSTVVLFPAPYRGPTPASHAKAQLIETPALLNLLQGPQDRYVLIDTSGLQQTLPNALSVPEAGSDGSLTDQFQASLVAWLKEETGRSPNAQLVFFGAGLQDRSSYNAALRAASAGYPTLWYRGGLEAWQAAGLALAPAAAPQQ